MKQNTKPSNKLIVSGLISIILAIIIYFGAQVWSNWDASHGDSVGANIGIGLIGLISLPVAVVGLVLLVAGIITAISKGSKNQ